MGVGGLNKGEKNEQTQVSFQVSKCQIQNQLHNNHALRKINTGTDDGAMASSCCGSIMIRGLLGSLFLYNVSIINKCMNEVTSLKTSLCFSAS